MKLGRVVYVPYAKPGSEELFSLFATALDSADGYLLANHGPLVGAKDMMEAFYALEELEESARIAWLLRGEPKARIIG
jgi:ribulose-5-phosphate 4-epimerase/fuculose-1-phosphate aldolase